MCTRIFVEYSTVDRWFKHVFGEGTRSAATMQTYLHFLKRFCAYLRKTPDEIIESRDADLKHKDDKIIQRRHEELVRNWTTYLEKEENLARGSAVTAHNVIKSFYNANYVPLVLKGPKSWITRIKKVPTRTELHDMISVCRNARDKAIIMCLAQSGISLKDFRELVTVNKVREELEAGTVPLCLRMERQKIKKKYETFLGKDAVMYLKEYVEELPEKDYPIFPFSKRTIQYVVERTSRRAELKPKHVSPHGLRAFFNTSLTLSFLGSTTQHLPIVEYWMGHVLPYKGAYMVPPIEDQRKLYADHEWALSIGEVE